MFPGSVDIPDLSEEVSSEDVGIREVRATVNESTVVSNSLRHLRDSPDQMIVDTGTIPLTFPWLLRASALPSRAAWQVGSTLRAAVRHRAALTGLCM